MFCIIGMKIEVIEFVKYKKVVLVGGDSILDWWIVICIFGNRILIVDLLDVWSLMKIFLNII